MDTLAIEVAGDSQSVTELTEKALEYLSAGGRMVWVIDASAGRVMVFTPPNHVQVLRRDDTLDGGDVLGGFSCPSPTCCASPRRESEAA